ncbi:MAG: outer membrane beta-barrel protein [Bacteroidota bacterium]
MKFKLIVFFAFLLSPFFSFAQKNTNYLKVAGQMAIPTGQLADIVGVGYGGSVKGIFGFSKQPQYLTVEAGYNRLGVKDLPAGSSGNYSAIPVYAGYRARLGQLIFDAQTGVSFNRIAASGPGGSASDTQTAFAWAVGASYEYKQVELGLRFQSSEANNDTFIIRFVGVRLGYNFKL